MTGFTRHDAVERDGVAALATSEGLAQTCFELAFREVEAFLVAASLIEARRAYDLPAIGERFRRSLAQATRDRLIENRGVPERNYLALFLIAVLLRPRLYVESGFFKGSSLFAAASAGVADTIIGFDPDHRRYRAKADQFGAAVELHRHDFREHAFEGVEPQALVYFDDHINTAARILEAGEKGFKTLIFDDSCGLMGTTERLWPSLPSLFFIQNIDRFEAGDFIQWPKDVSKQVNLLGGRVTLKLGLKRTGNRFTLTPDIIDLCRRAKALIRYSAKIPDLNDFIVTPRRLNANDITQHLVVLK